MTRKSSTDQVLPATPTAFLQEAVRQVPALRYAIGVGGIAAVVSVVLTAWKLEPQTAILGGLVVFAGMVVLVIFAALSRTGPRVLRPLALTLAWSFLVIALGVAVLFVSCAFYDRPKNLPCLLRGEGCPKPDRGKDDGELRAMQHPKERAQAEAALVDFYAGRYEKLYDQFAPAVREAFSFVQFRNNGRRQVAQVRGGPLHRKFVLDQVTAGFLTIAFEAEFDEVSTWMEGVTFARTPKGWELYQFNIQPATWKNAAGNAKVLAETDPTVILERLQTGKSTPDTIVGYWIPLSTWRSRVVAVASKHGERTCDVELRAGGSVLLAKNLLGGCGLERGTDLDIWGKLVAASGQRLEVDEVRFQLAGT